MNPTDIREANDPARDASRPYGQASADENALRSLASVGERATLPTPDARDRNKRTAPVALPSLVAPGTVLPRESTPDENGFDVGGMGRTYPFKASNEISQMALLSFPKAVQDAFRNRKIDRPVTLPESIYGRPANAGGYYDPNDKSIALARGNAQAYGDPNIDVGGARHEILHAISYEGRFFSQDQKANYPELRAAITEALPTIMANPSTTKAAAEAKDALAKNDPDHAFTAIGDLYLQGVPLPHALQAYFDQMQNYQSAEPVAASPTTFRTPQTSNYTPSTHAQRMVDDLNRSSEQRAAETERVTKRWFASGGASAEQGWNEITANFGSAVLALGGAIYNPGTKEAEPVRSVAGGLLKILGSPFTATAETIRTEMVTSVPELNSVYQQALTEASKAAPTDDTIDAAEQGRRQATLEAAAAQHAIDQGRTALWNAAGEKDLPWETRSAAMAGATLLGAESAGEFGIPSLVYRIPAAFRAISRWNLFQALRSAEAAPADEAVQMRLAALDQARDSNAAQERAAAAALGVSPEQGPIASKVATGQSQLRVSKAEAAGEQAKADAKVASTNQVSSNALLQKGIDARQAAIPAAARRNLGDIINERMRINALRSQVLGEVPVTITPQDEQAILTGIHATVEQIGPQLEARTQNLGDLLTRSAKNAERQMFSALRRAMTEGETFTMKNVTVGEDAEGKAVRLRSMVGSFDQAIASIRNAAAGGGREAQGEELLTPFLEARKAAMDALQAQDAYNAAVKANRTLAVSEYRTASKAATQARLAEKRAAQAVTRTEKTVGKVETSVGAQESKQADRTESTVDTLQTRIDKAKAAAADAAESVKLRVGGDSSPQIAHAASGYVAPDIAEVWQRNRLHTGTFDDPLVGDAMAAWVREHPGQIDAGEHSWQQFTSSVASLTGADIERVQRAIPKTGELTRTFYVAEQVFGQLVKEWRATGAAVRDGAATEAQLADKTAQVMAFEDALRRGVGEQGRALAARNLVKKADAVQVLAANERVRLSYSSVEKLAKQIDNLEGQVAAATAANDGPLLAKARARLEQAVSEFETAKTTLDEARTASAAAADEVYKMALRKAVAQGASRETAAVLAKFDPEDIVPIAAFLRSLKPQGVGALAMRLLTAGRYGKIPSQILNFVGTGANVLYQEALIRPLTAATSPLASKLSGVEKLRAPNETRSAWLGVWSATPDAGRFLARTLWQGKADEIALKHGIADYETLIGQGLDSGSPVFRIGGHTFELTGPKAIPLDVTLRALYGSDGFWRIMLASGDRNAAAALRAYRAGQGTKGAVRAVAENLSIEEREAAHAEGLIKTFNEPIRRDRAGNILEKAESRFTDLLGVDVGGFAPLRLLIPAARFGMRSVETGLRYSGGGLLTGTRLAMRARDASLTLEQRTALGRQGAREMAEGAVGAGMLVLGFNFAASGVTTGAYPQSESERNRWKTLGIQPMSFKIGDRYIPMGWFGPLAAPFALAALIHDGSAEQDDAALTDRIQRGAMGVGQYVMDQPAMYATKSLVDAITSAVQGNAEGVNTLLAQIGTATSIGALAQSMTAVFDPYQRDPEGLIQRMFSRYGGLSLTVPPKIDQRTGQPIERSVSGPGALLATDIGQARSEADLSAVERETLGVKIGNLSQTITSGGASVKLSQEQFKSYEANARQKANAAAAKIIETATYKENPDPLGRQAMLKAAYDKAATDAREELATSLVASAKTPDEVYNAAIVARAAQPEFRYVLTIGTLSDGRLTPEVANRIDATRARRADGTAAPTVSDLRQAASYVRQFVAIRPFLRGDSQEWAQVQEQRAEMAAIKASKGQSAADAYARAHPLIGMYADGRMTNPARKTYLDSHPAIKSLVGGSDWEWVK